MSAEIVTLGKGKRPKRRGPPRPPTPIQEAAETALRLLRFALHEFSGVESRKAEQIVVLVGHAVTELERGTRSGIDEARHDVGEIVIKALGGASVVTCGQIESVRAMLSLLRDSLPDYSREGAS
jgi:hypothetical protein